ncbi:MAG: DUF1501 domain-containing protein [Prosthecobacter sp.]|jgi:uncharacterized protein (DUF1501 family)|uniref:DUF1501 domain-containing protein n=1 Tax=Prosthecobacter sp. TaxID=1965333 RepID=UPI0019FB4051|nr:DUF1501 domain-containing protein [Prosthecobacter sp.]MBE2287677.1 DUF1501 domain-containing protein [Prosthecobacter sp.]
MTHPLNQLDDLARREFITRMAKTSLGVSLVPPAMLARAVETSAPKFAGHIIYLYMRGGMSHLDTFDTKPDAPAGYQGSTRTIKTKSPDLQISGFFPKLAEHGDKLAVVRSMHHTQGAHEPGMYKVLTGYEVSPSVRHPALGSWVARQVTQGASTLPSYIRLADLSGHPGAGFMDARYAPVPVLDPSKGLEHTQLQQGDSMANLRKRTGLADKLNTDFLKRYPMAEVKAHADVFADAIKLMTSKDLDAFDITKEKGSLINDYGANYFGQGVLLARRLVERGCKFVEIELGGWDTHSNNFATVETLSKAVDDAVATLLEDLEARGLLETTLVVLTTEFGRSPKLKGLGRDHHPIAFSSFIAGGGVKGGQAYGKTDETGTRIVENPVTVLDFHATIGKLMGVSPHDLIPGAGGSFNIYGGTGAKRGVPIPAFV